MKTRCSAGGLTLTLGLFLATASAEPKVGDLVFQTGFEEAGALSVWGAGQKSQVHLAPGFQSAQSLQVEAPPGVSSNTSVRLVLPVGKLEGARLHCRAMVKAAGVTLPPKPWNGIKFMLHLTGPGGEQWQQQDSVAGTFDWKVVQFRATVPAGVTNAELILGLEAVNGRAQFDDLKLTVLRGPRIRPVIPPQGPVFTGHEEPRLRGAMIHPDITPEGLRVLGQEWKANLIRWQLIRYGEAAKIATFAEYDVWLEGELRKLENALPLCEKYGVRVVLDLHSPPGGQPTAGGYVGSDAGLFNNPAAQAKFIEIWQRMARRFRDNQVIWGYDLANEPVEEEVAEGCDDWQALVTRTARAVREIDPRHAIIIEPAPWGGPEALANLEPLPVSGVVYSVHVYVPHEFTHQGVHTSSPGLSYPGEIAGKYWDKEQLRRALQPVRDWQRDYGVQIYIGEFSAIRWAPDDSAYRYLKDCIELFEAYGWDWSYHAFREWSGWSVEHGPDRQDTSPSLTPTSRGKLLRSWFARNREPK
jgi:endoglucanase